MIAPHTLDAMFGQRRAPDGTLASANFARWFGNSVVVDEGGAPLVVFHGTRRDFTAFDAMANKTYDVGVIGHFFTADPATASMYARGRGGRLIPVYLSINRPKEEGLKRLGRFESIDEVQEYVEELKADRYDGVIFRAGSQTEYVAFHSCQIKSATANCGAFSRGDPSITDALAVGMAMSNTVAASRRRLKP